MTVRVVFVGNSSERFTEILKLTSLKWVLMSWEQKRSFSEAPFEFPALNKCS